MLVTELSATLDSIFNFVSIRLLVLRRRKQEMPMTGVEPARHVTLDPKSRASASSATSARYIRKKDFVRATGPSMSLYKTY